MIDPDALRSQSVYTFLQNPLEVCRGAADKEYAESPLWHPPGMEDYAYDRW
jgi:hypothetical protein